MLYKECREMHEHRLHAKHIAYRADRLGEPRGNFKGLMEQ